MPRRLLIFGTILLTAQARAADLWSDLRPLYEDLHAHPELSKQETATAAKLAGKLRALGFEVTEKVAGTGVVGILKNGAGPVVMLRTELDALPVAEQTGLPYASKNPGVMHACGHDVHMTAWTGAATTLAADRASWKGTLMMVAQPAEEIGWGAKAMLDDGLFTRFPRPAAVFAIHDNDRVPSGTVAIKPGPMMASADSVDIVVHGVGGHGGQPHTTIDPVVIAAKIVLVLQVLVSRENDPFDPAVITVGSIHGGTRHNIIPDEVTLQLTVRAFRREVRDRLIAGLERVAAGEAAAAGAPRAPEVTVAYSVGPTANDLKLTGLVEPALKRALGEARVAVAQPVLPAEDFGLYGDAGSPIVLMFVGAHPAEKIEAAAKSGTKLPGLHSSEFAPDARATIMTGVESLVAAARAVLAR